MIPSPSKFVEISFDEWKRLTPKERHKVDIVRMPDGFRVAVYWWKTYDDTYDSEATA